MANRAMRPIIAGLMDETLILEEISATGVVSSLWLDRNVANRCIPATGQTLHRAACGFCRDFLKGCARLDWAAGQKMLCHQPLAAFSL